MAKHFEPARESSDALIIGMYDFIGQICEEYPVEQIKLPGNSMLDNPPSPFPLAPLWGREFSREMFSVLRSLCPEGERAG
jgi:hypothetical protein